MAVKKFPVEYTHIMMFARSVGDENPIYHDEEYAKKTEVWRHHRAPDIHAGERAVRSGLFPAPESRQTLARFRQNPHRHCRPNPKPKAKKRKAAAVAAACMPSSISNITGLCARAMC